MRIANVFGLALMAVVLTACNSGGESPSGGAEAPKNTAGSSPMKVGIVFDSGGRGDKSFNDSAYAGIEKAKAELGAEDKAVDSKSEKDYEGNLSTLGDQDCGVIFAVGFAQSNALKTVAPKYPETKFAIIDAEVDAPNVRSIVFAEEQGSFLAGYLAALVTKTNKIGFVGGKHIPLIEKFECGYIAGARTANPKVEVLPSKYTESWDDVGLGKASASVLFDQGADIIYHAAGRCGIGVITAAKETGKFAIGVDSDQDDQAPGNVLTSMIKRVDVAVFSTVQDVKNGSFTAGTKRYDLASGGVGLSDFRHTKDKIGEDNLKKVEQAKQMIIKGEIKVPATPDELKAFKPVEVK